MLPARIEDTDILIKPALVWSELEMPPAPLLVLIVALVLLLLLALWGWRSGTTRKPVARKADVEAEKLLRSLDFTVLERQPTRRWRLEIDGESWQATCRVDLLVKRGQRLYVADVKTGDEAPRPHLPSTRRQLLESLLAFEADGALLVDMRRRRVRTISFPDRLS